MAQDTIGKEIEKRLSWQVKNAWDKMSEEDKKKTMAFAEDTNSF